MSGGHFDYNQYKIGYIADKIQLELDRQGQKNTDDYWKSDAIFETYPDHIQKIFKDAIFSLRVAQVYAHRIDWYLSGDDGEESFCKRLLEDLRQLE